MPVDGVTPILNVSDVPASVEWFEAYGWKRGFTWNNGGDMECALENDHGRAHFGSVCAAKATIFLCRGGQGPRPGVTAAHTSGADVSEGVWMTWWVTSRAEVDRFHALALERGDVVGRTPADEAWGVREFWLVHPDGHTFRVSCGL